MADKKGAKGGAKSAPAAVAKKKRKGLWTIYEVQGDKLVRKNSWSPKAGEGYFMARHQNRQTCGQSGYTEFSKN